MEFDDLYPGVDPMGNPYRRRIFTTQDKNTPLNTNPHYSDPNFREPQTVFGTGDAKFGNPGLAYDYSDRLFAFDPDKYDAAMKAAAASGATDKSARFYEAFLAAYNGRPVELRHVIAGVKPNGYAWVAFGYVFKDAKTGV